MKYIENDGHVTREYEVKINTKELEKIIKELVTKCYRVVDKKVKVIANNQKEAVEKINAIDKEGVKVRNLEDISNLYHHLEVIPFGLTVYNCEYLSKQNSYLVYLLENILSNYRSSLAFKNQNARFLDLLVQYANSDELKPYDERIREYDEKLLELDDNNSFKKVIEEKKQSALSEMEHNPNYDFALLNELYNQAKDCFELRLVSETIHYKDLDKNPKIYKLGTKKTF